MHAMVPIEPSRQNGGKRKRGRPKHEPTEALRIIVKTLKGFAIPENKIAESINIDVNTLKKHYESELSMGETLAIIKVTQSLFRKAISNRENMATFCAARFWLQNRAGWTDGGQTPAALNDNGKIVRLILPQKNNDDKS